MVQRLLYALSLTVMSVFALPGGPLAGPDHASASPTVTVVMRGLDNPRGLAFGPEGALYVAEAGRGGIAPCIVAEDNGMWCAGPTGAVSRFWRGQQTRIASGLPSLARRNSGASANGPADVGLLGLGSAYVTVGLQNDPRRRGELGELGSGFAQLVQLAATSGQWRYMADLGAYEATSNPDPRLVDSNPYGLLVEPGARIVTDAGGNSLLRIAANGEISTLAMFPSRPQRATDSVPTSVVRGPEGAYYVGELTGVPFPAGAANIYKVVPGQPPEVYLTGFQTIIDLAFAADGSLYVLEHATGLPPVLSRPGALIRVDPQGGRSEIATGVPLDRPAAIAFGPDGALYVSNHSTSAGIGEVLRIVL
jgi:hypothetical protein